MYIGDVEITRREVLASLIIFFLMLGLGFWLNVSLVDDVAKTVEVYSKAVKIDKDATQFEYAMDTNLGNALVYGEASCIDAVTIPQLQGEYWYIEEKTQRYTMHTRTVTVNGITKTEIDYHWDTVKTRSWSAKQFSFLGKEFPCNILSNLDTNCLGVTKDDISDAYRENFGRNHLYEDNKYYSSVGDLRYSYKVIPKTFQATVFTSLEDGTMKPPKGTQNSVLLYYEQDIPETIRAVKSDQAAGQIFFWILWIFLTGFVLFLFVQLENKWLED